MQQNLMVQLLETTGVDLGKEYCVFRQNKKNQIKTVTTILVILTSFILIAWQLPNFHYEINIIIQNSSNIIQTLRKENSQCL